jgi:hypothetical protein
LIEVRTGDSGRPVKKLRRIAADKGYDSEELRTFLRGQRNSAADSKKKYAKK